MVRLKVNHSVITIQYFEYLHSNMVRLKVNSEYL